MNRSEKEKSEEDSPLHTRSRENLKSHYVKLGGVSYSKFHILTSESPSLSVGLFTVAQHKLTDASRARPSLLISISTI
jgi:hypothetical protein